MPMQIREYDSFDQRAADRSVMRLKLDREDMEDVALKLGKDLVYPAQKAVAMEIAGQLLCGDALLVTLCASMQWGKTGVLVEVGCTLCTHPDKAILPQNVIILTGMSDNEWRTQTASRMPPGFRVWHRGDLNKHSDSLFDISNALLIIDECHLGAAEGSKLANALSEAGLLNIETLKQRNVRILQTSATPDHVLENSEKWNIEGGPEYHFKIVPENPPSYISPKDLVNQRRALAVMDLKNLVTARSLVVKMLAYSTAKYHIIRLPSRDKDDVVSNLESLAVEFGIDMLQHDCSVRIINIDELLACAPKKHTIIMIKGMWRAAKTLCDEHLGILHEAFTKGKKSDSAEVQSLIGRCCGHNKNCGTDAPVVYCSLSAVKDYIDLMEQQFNYNRGGVTTYHSQNIDKSANSDPRAAASYAEPRAANGLVDARPPAAPRLVAGRDFQITVTEFACENGESKENAFLRIKKDHKHLRNPFKDVGHNGFTTTSTTKTKRVYLYDELKNEISEWNGRAGFGTMPTTMVKGKQTRRMYVVYRSKDVGQEKKPVFVIRTLTALEDCCKKGW